jgi:hypothetical protein
MLTLKSVAALPANTILWDDGKGSISGFGARRRTGASVAYVLKYRTAEGRQRWLLGNLKVAAVTAQDIERFRDAVTAGATQSRIKTGKHGA